MRISLWGAAALLALPTAALAQWSDTAQSYNDWAVSSALTTMNAGAVERSARAAAKGSGTRRVPLSRKSEALCAGRDRTPADSRGRRLDELCRMAGR